MSAVECLEHKWLSESSQPLKNSTKQDSTIIVTTTATTTLTTIPTDSTPDKHRIESNNDTIKSREVDSMSVATSSPKSSAGFFLHQSPKNGTALDEVLFSSLNNGFNTTANTNASKMNGMDHQHHNHHTHHHHHPSVEHAKQHATTVNNSCSLNPNDTTDLLKDYATNKENINLSKILSNRSSANHQSLINNRTTLHNNNNSNNNNNNNNSSSSGSSTTYDYADDSSNLSNVLTTVQQSLAMPATNASAVQTKHESILFPDAPTTPKVLRKSNQSETDTPSCVALVKQFQLNNGSLSNRIDFDEINSVSESTTYPQQSSSLRSKYTNHTEHTREVLPSYRLSATAITTSTTNGHHSLGSSALSINTLTESSVGVSQQHSNSSITMNCLCGADKTANCCCNSSSRTALNYRKKSLAVVDSSILC